MGSEGAGHDQRRESTRLKTKCPASRGVSRSEISGGAGRSRTALEGFAILCITALLPRPELVTSMKKESRRLKREAAASLRIVGAGDESRTRDLNLGKVALYQLSYSRIARRIRIRRSGKL
jgi:hypothetical protein